MSLFFNPTTDKIAAWQSENNGKKLAKASKSDDAEIRAAAIDALFAVNDPKYFNQLEKLFIEDTREIKKKIAEGFRACRYTPQKDNVQFEMLFILADKDALVSVTTDPTAFLFDIVKRAPSEEAEFAAAILQERKWIPKTKEEETYHFLASNKLEDIKEIDKKQADILSNYILKQSDIQFRRKAFNIIADEDNESFLPVIEKHKNDKDETISERAQFCIKEIKGRQALEYYKSKIERFFKNPAANISEQNATVFIKMGIDFLRYDLLHEAFCALALANYIYLELAGGFVVDEKYSFGDLTLQKDREIKIYNEFDLGDSITKIGEKIRGKNEAQSLLQVIQDKNQDEEINKINLSELVLNIIYPEFVDNTINLLIQKQDDNIRAWRAMLDYSDERFIPHLIDAFKFDFLVFDPVQALIYLDTKSIPALIDCFNHENAYYRTNAAFALGIIEEEDALPALAAALKNETELTVKLFIKFAQMRINNDNAGLDFIVENLDHDEAEVRKCAFRCLQHLDQPLDLERVSKLLFHVDEWVRIFSVKVICNSSEELSQDVVKKLVTRFLEEQDDDVYAAFENNLGDRKEKILAEALLSKLKNSDSKRQASIVSILGNMNYENAVQPLVTLYSKAHTELKQNILWALGQIGTIEHIDIFTKAVQQNGDISRSAALGLYFLSAVDEQKVKEALKNINTDDALIAKGLLMNDSAIKTINSKISSHNDIQRIMNGLNLVSIVKNEAFTEKLIQLLDYSNSDYYPADRYVRQGAIEALVGIYC